MVLIRTLRTCKVLRPHCSKVPQKLVCLGKSLLSAQNGLKTKPIYFCLTPTTQTYTDKHTQRHQILFPRNVPSNVAMGLGMTWHDKCPSWIIRPKRSPRTVATCLRCAMTECTCNAAGECSCAAGGLVEVSSRSTDTWK